VIGTGLFKPAISAVVGLLYKPDDPSRGFGFNLFMRGVWAGSLMAALVGGATGEKLGWHYGLMLASLGMVIGLATYLVWGRESLGSIGRRTKARAALEPITPSEKRRITGLAILSIFTTMYAISFYQQVGLYHITIEAQIDRSLFGYEIPATWFLAISTLTFVCVGPIVQALSDRRTASGRRFDVFDKACIGLALSSAAQFILLLGPFGDIVETAGPWGLCLTAMAYVLFGVADLYIWPPQIAAATELAPRDRESLTIGLWYVSIGVGSYLAGYLGQFAHKIGMDSFIALVGLSSMAGLLLLAVAAPRLRALTSMR
jgi:POT family proton-dependent oligopeptide transporter